MSPPMVEDSSTVYMVNPSTGGCHTLTRGRDGDGLTTYGDGRTLTCRDRPPGWLLVGDHNHR